MLKQPFIKRAPQKINRVYGSKFCAKNIKYINLEFNNRRKVARKLNFEMRLILAIINVGTIVIQITACATWNICLMLLFRVSITSQLTHFVGQWLGIIPSTKLPHAISLRELSRDSTTNVFLFQTVSIRILIKFHIDTSSYVENWLSGSSSIITMLFNN